MPQSSQRVGIVQQMIPRVQRTFQRVPDLTLGSLRSPSSGLLRQGLDRPLPLLPSPSPPSSPVLVIRTTRHSRMPPQTCYPSRKEYRVWMRLKLTLKTMESQYGKECVQGELVKIVSDRGMGHDHVRCRDCKIGRFSFWTFCPDSCHRVDHPYHKCYNYQCPCIL